MTFLNFSDYLKFQLNRDIQGEEFSKFILNQKLMRIGKQSEMNANIIFFYDNTTELLLSPDNSISGDKIEFHSCDRHVIYYAIVGKEGLLLKAEMDKAVVAHNLIFLIKKVSLIEVTDIAVSGKAAAVEVREEAYA